MDMIDIKIDGVKKSFKDVKAVNNISLEIKKGEFVALLGPNGAGKTTLVEMIEGIQHPDQGEILIQNKKWKGNQEELNRILGISLQETHFFQKISVLETLNLFGSFYKVGRKKIAEIIELTGLETKMKAWVKNLSGGQRQKLALAIALINEPKILLLDEPTTGLDPAARREIWNILKNLKKEKETTLILTTHYMEEAETICERIIIMHNGKILAQGSMNELLEQNNCSQMVQFSLKNIYNTKLVQEKLTEFDIKWHGETGNGKFLVQNISEQLQQFLSQLNKKNIELESLESRKMTLDDLFISMTGRHLSG